MKPQAQCAVLPVKRTVKKNKDFGWLPVINMAGSHV